MRDILHIYSEINISTILTNQSKGANLCFFKKKKEKKEEKIDEKYQEKNMKKTTTKENLRKKK